MNICFDYATAGFLKKAFSDEKNAAFVFDLSTGKIKERLNENCNNTAISKVLDLAKSHQLRIVYSDFYANDYLSYLFVIATLKENDLTANISVYNSHIGQIRSFGEVSADNFNRNLDYQDLANDEIEQCFLKWQEVLKSDAELRVMENGELKSVPLEYYDDQIKEQLHQGKKGLEIVGYLVNNYGHEHKVIQASLDRLLKEGA